MRPHFLFNALNTIVSFCRTDPEKARALIIHLAEFFRRNLQPGGEMVSLATELEHVRSYLAIEQARHGDKLRVIYDVEEAALAHPLPALVLQPLVENAVKHGLLPTERGGTVLITAGLRGGVLEVSVGDDGMGMGHAAPKGIGLALTNTDRRLRALYGPQNGLDIESQPGCGTKVTVRVPTRTSQVLEQAVESAHR
jgi:two-component system sensor histidine kinase LytS